MRPGQQIQSALAPADLGRSQVGGVSIRHSSRRAGRCVRVNSEHVPFPICAEHRSLADKFRQGGGNLTSFAINNLPIFTIIGGRPLDIHDGGSRCGGAGGGPRGWRGRAMRRGGSGRRRAADVAKRKVGDSTWLFAGCARNKAIENIFFQVDFKIVLAGRARSRNRHVRGGRNNQGS